MTRMHLAPDTIAILLRAAEQQGRARTYREIGVSETTFWRATHGKGCTSDSHMLLTSYANKWSRKHPEGT